jgi:hypothetical protein
MGEFWDQLVHGRPDLTQTDLFRHMSETHGLSFDLTYMNKCRNGKRIFPVSAISKLLACTCDEIGLTVEDKRSLARLWLGTLGIQNPQELAAGVGLTNEQVDLITGQHMTAATKEVVWLRLVIRINRLFRDLSITYPPEDTSTKKDEEIADKIGEAFDLIAECYCDFYGPNFVTRMSIGTRTAQDPNQIQIKWDKGLDRGTKKRNSWYCGPKEVDKSERGLPGYIFSQARYHGGKGAWVADVSKHPEYFDRRKQPHRREYQSAVWVIIRPVPDAEPLGQLCVDSLYYTFRQDDHELLTLVAQEIGWMLARTGAQYHSGSAKSGS